MKNSIEQYIVLNPTHNSLLRNPIGNAVGKVGDYIELQFAGLPNIFPFHRDRVSKIHYGGASGKAFYRNAKGGLAIVPKQLEEFLNRPTLEKFKPSNVEVDTIECLHVLLQIIEDPKKAEAPKVKHKLEQIKTLVSLYRENFSNKGISEE